MALDEDQIISALTLLDLPSRTDTTFYFSGEQDRDRMRAAEIARRSLSVVTSSQETATLAILAQWAAIRYDTDTIKAEGLDSDPGRLKAELGRQLCNVIGFSVPIASFGMRIERG